MRQEAAVTFRHNWWVDVIIICFLGAIVYGIVSAGSEWAAPLRHAVEIDLNPLYLPKYALYSLYRSFAAYLISLTFTLVYGYIAAHNARAERIMIPFLDVLQSIPVLGFMPGLVLALVGLFPKSNIGLELAAILMIFTSQVWDMTFSFYHSLRSIPKELNDASYIYRLSWWRRFIQLELPYSAIGLVWNSMMSMAGGWFFLMISEAFILGNKDFRLPGLGSYMSVAVQQGNIPAMLFAIGTMIALIVITDQLLWRPLVAWSQKFKVEEVQTHEVPRSFVLDFLRKSVFLKTLLALLSQPVIVSKRRAVKISPCRWCRRRKTQEHEASPPITRRSPIKKASIALQWFCLVVMSCGVGYGIFRLAFLLPTVGPKEWLHILEGAGFTFLRTTTAIILGSLWTIPLGVAIGTNPKLSRLLQPVIQVTASFPAPMVFPIIITFWTKIGGSIEYGAVLLMMMGTQWYILFNTVAGAMAIPQDIRDASIVYKLRRWTRWKVLLLPAIFPYLVTGWVTAAGGAWNASIVAEYVHFGDRVLIAHGIGSNISLAAAHGNFGVLAASLIIMSLLVVSINRLLWARLYHLAETRFAVR